MTRSPWYTSWFDSPYYHKLYAHRDRAEAAAFVDALVRELRPDPGSTMLDLGCGTGRHARRLAAKGFTVTGLDLSERSLRHARRFARPRLRFVRQDMRVPFGRQAYDYVFSFFTSFGYFDGVAEHVGVVRNVAEALRAGGRLVLDYLNVPHAETRSVAAETKTIDGVVYRLTRWRDERHLYKRIVVADGREGSVEHVERVARFVREDFQRMLGLHGLFVEHVFGDYRLGPYDADASPRLILVARKEARALRRAS